MFLRTLQGNQPPSPTTSVTCCLWLVHQVGLLMLQPKDKRKWKATKKPLTCIRRMRLWEHPPLHSCLAGGKPRTNGSSRCERRKVMAYKYGLLGEQFRQRKGFNQHSSCGRVLLSQTTVYASRQLQRPHSSRCHKE